MKKHQISVSDCLCFWYKFGASKGSHSKGRKTEWKREVESYRCTWNCLKATSERESSFEIKKKKVKKCPVRLEHWP